MLLKQDQFAQKVAHKPIDWHLVAELKNEDGSLSTGFAGAINGVSNEVFIIAGGANFLDKLPWEGGVKHYSDELHILHKSGDQFIWDKRIDLKLPEPIAYCGSITTENGIVYAGGENDKGLSRSAYLINWDTRQRSINIHQLPDLPKALTNIALTHIKNKVYAIGGDELNNSSAGFYSIALDANSPKWEKLADLPVPIANTLAIAQNSPNGLCIYSIGGRTKTLSGISELHHTVFKYILSKGIWEKCADISDGTIMNFSAGTGLAFGNQSILVAGGDNGLVFHQIETYLARIKQASTKEERERFTQEKNELNIHHKGFYKGILLYDTFTDKWMKIGELPFPAQVTTTATWWDHDIVLSNGEIKPGVRTPNIMMGKLLINER